MLVAIATMLKTSFAAVNMWLGGELRSGSVYSDYFELIYVHPL
jgi:hypothetical protein